MKKTTATVIKLNLKHSPMSEANTCTAKPDLGSIALNMIQESASLVSFY